MSAPFTYDVFLSYSTHDKDIVLKLAKRLKNDGLRVWLDKWVIKPGEMIGRAVQHGLEKSRTLVLCMSPAYYESEWGTLEYQTLLFRDPVNTQRRFIPLLIEDCTPPDIIAQFAYIDWRKPSDESYAKLIDACRGEKGETKETDLQEEYVDQAVMVLRGHMTRVKNVVVTPEGNMAISIGDFTLKLWDLNTGECVETLRVPERFFWGLAITPDGKKIICSMRDYTLQVWDIESRKKLRTLKVHNNQVSSVIITSDGKKAVSGSWDKILKVWDIKYGTCYRTITIDSNLMECSQFAITPDNKKIVSSTGIGSIITAGKIGVWDLETGKLLLMLKGHTAYVRSVTVTPNGQKIISGAMDSTLKVWDLTSGKCIATFEDHTAQIYGIAITPDGTRVVSGSEDKTIRV